MDVLFERKSEAAAIEMFFSTLRNKPKKLIEQIVTIHSSNTTRLLRQLPIHKKKSIQHRTHIRTVSQAENCSSRTEGEAEPISV